MMGPGTRCARVALLHAGPSTRGLASRPELALYRTVLKLARRGDRENNAVFTRMNYNLLSKHGLHVNFGTNQNMIQEACRNFPQQPMAGSAESGGTEWTSPVDLGFLLLRKLGLYVRMTTPVEGLQARFEAASERTSVKQQVAVSTSPAQADSRTPHTAPFAVCDSRGISAGFWSAAHKCARDPGDAAGYRRTDDAAGYRRADDTAVYQCRHDASAYGRADDYGGRDGRAYGRADGDERRMNGC